MHRENTISAFSGVNEQTAALEQWKSKNLQHSSKLRNLSQRISTHKKCSEESTKNRRWIFDRDTLNAEQEACDAAVTSAMYPIQHLLGDQWLEITANRIVVQEEIREKLRSIRVQQTQSIDKRQEATESLQALLYKEGQQAASDLVACEEQEDLSISGSQTINAIFESNSEKVRSLKVAYMDGCDDIHSVFQQVLDSEYNRILDRIGSVESAVSFATSPDILRSILLIIKMSYRARGREAGTGQTRELFSRVAQQYTHFSRSEVTRAVEEAMYIRKRQALLRTAALDFRRSSEELFNTYESALQTQVEARRCTAWIETENENTRNRQKTLHSDLAKKREVYNEQCRMKEAAEKAIQDAKDQLEQEKRAKLMEEFQERLARLAQYEQAKKALQEKQAELERLRIHEEELQRIERMEKNEKRVTYRQQEREERMERQQRADEELAALRAEKEAALRRFFESVEEKLDVKSDPLRVLQATESSGQSESYLTFASAGMPSYQGYTDEQVMRDPRVRLYHALLQARLHTTPYGREVVSRNYKIPAAQMMSENNPFRNDI